jgi:hypothetical protein
LLTARSIRFASLSSLIRLINKSATPVATPYPALFTRSIKFPNFEISGLYSTVARSDDKLTLAEVTPVSFFRLRSTVETQLAQVIPVMGKIICFDSDIISPKN